MEEPPASIFRLRGRSARPLAWHLFRLCLALVLPVLAFAIVLAWLYVDSERANLEKTGLEAARGGVHVLDRELTRAIIAGQVLAKSRSIATADWDRAAQRAAGVGQELGLSIRLYDRTGRVVADTAATPGSPLPTAPTLPPGNAAWTAAQPTVSDFLPDGPAGSGVRIAVPVRDAGPVTAMLIMTLPAGRMRDIVAAPPDPWVVIVTDRQGVILARSEGQQPPVGRPMPAALLSAAANLSDGILAGGGFTVGGSSVLAAFSRSAYSGWTVWAVAPVAETDAPMRRSIGSLVALAALLAVLSSALATAFAQGIARSVAALAAEARRLGRGEAVGLPPSDVTEVGEVGAALALAATDRLAAEARLQQQNRDLQRISQRLTDILDALPAQVVLLDTDGRIAAVNEAWRINELVGPPGSAKVDDNYLAACLPGARAGDPAIVATLEGLRAILAGRRQRYETTYAMVGPGVPVRWFQCIAVAHELDHETGRAAGAVVMHLEITERVQVQQALADSEARLRLFIERTPAPIAVFDTAMRYLQVSRRFLSDYGLAETGPAALLGRSHYDIFPDMSDAWRDVHRRVLSHGETLSSADDAFIRSDGRTDWVRWEMTPWRHQDGSIGGAVLFTEVITQRKQAEAALRDSEARLRLAIDATELGTWDEDLLTGHAVWNDMTFRILGLDTTAALAGQTVWRRLIHPDDRQRVADAYRTAQAGGTLFRCEHRIVRPDGGIRWIRPLGRFLQGALGEALRFVGVVSDITVLKQAGERQERLLQLIEQSSDFIALADGGGRLTYLNRGGRRMIGLDEDADLSGLNFADYVAPASRTLFETILIPTVTAQGLWEGEMQLVNQRTGAPIDVYRATFALRDEAGELTGYGTVTHDITADKQAEAALAESEARLRSILESVPDGMVLSDESGTIQSFSATAERLFGWSAAEAIGRNVSMLMGSPDRDEHDGHMARYLNTGVGRVIGTGRTVTGLRKDGTTFPTELSLCELRVGGRRLFTAFLRDLTERRATEARLQQMQAELAHVSRLSTVGAMASGLAHELNQPLTAVASAVRASQRMMASATIVNAPASLNEAMTLAAAQALRAGQIVRRLRDFIARGGETDRRMESLPALIEDGSALALAGAQESGLRARFALAPGLPWVLVDRVQIQQVLVNLIRNAIQAMTDHPEDGAAPAPPDLTITARVADPDTVEVAIADNGPGVAPEVAERLFEPFVTTRDGGMGVGLSICKSIVEAHGGRLWAEANPSGGMIFRFTLQSVPRDAMLPKRGTDEHQR